MSRPNVIYMHSHDTGCRVSPYGYAVATPHLQKFASRAVLFRKAFCAAPTCSPSRAALLCGQHAHCTGMLGLHHRGFRLAHPKHHLASYLRDNGYQTSLLGVNHVAAEPDEIGYSNVYARQTRNSDEIAAAAEDVLRSKPEQPFFLDIGFVDTHRGVFPESGELHPGDDPRHMRPPENVPDTPETRLDSARFATAARRLDEGMGRVLRALHTADLQDNTIVIITTDHGVGFPWHKCNCTDAGMGVMLMIAGPHQALRPGATCGALVSQIDLFPSLCEMLSLDPPAYLQGKSLLPVLLGERSNVNEEIFGEVTYHAAYEPQRAVRTRRWKLIRRFGDRAMPVPSNIDDGPTKSVLLEAGLLDRAHPRDALYDLVLDPQEKNNLAGYSTVTDIHADLAARLERWMRDTADPLLNGPVPLPQGALANLPDDLSAKDAFRQGRVQ